MTTYVNQAPGLDILNIMTTLIGSSDACWG